MSRGYPSSRARFDVFFSEKLRLYAIGELFVFLLWQIVTFLGISIIADEFRNMFKRISRRFENYQFLKLGSALMTQMPIDVFIELISLLNISVDFKVNPSGYRMISASVFDTLWHCRAEISFLCTI